jgi:hypothetical protein
MQLDQITQLLIQDFKLLANKLLKQENIAILIDIIQPVNIRANGPPQLPPVRSLQVVQTHAVRVNVLQLADVDHVLGLDQACEQLEVVRDVGLLWAEAEVLFLVGNELALALED